MSDVLRPRLLHQLGCRLSNVDTLVVPICRAFHWILVVFDLANTRITVYDSMPAYRGYFTHALKPAAEILDKLKKVTMYIYIYLYIYICVCICMCKRVYINIFTELYVSNTLGKEPCRILHQIISRDIDWYHGELLGSDEWTHTAVLGFPAHGSEASKAGNPIYRNITHSTNTITSIMTVICRPIRSSLILH